ncbi:hypothetical protein [Actinosynnema sp. NPDC023587]|uniref:hypothetical protein n=1 Tax=Actinosynnema sp. NPDC023587 TaxID=3154695 RepID=UPI0033DA32EC
MLLVAFLYLYLAVCATDEVSGVHDPAPVVSVAAPSPGDHHHGTTDGFGVLIRHSDCFLLVGGDLLAGVLVLLALWLCAVPAVRHACGLVPPGADRTRPPPGTASGREVLLSLCVART